MPTAKVTKNVSAATGGGNVLCSTLISIKTKAWLYSFICHTKKSSSSILSFMCDRFFFCNMHVCLGKVKGMDNSI